MKQNIAKILANGALCAKQKQGPVGVTNVAKASPTQKAAAT